MTSKLHLSRCHAPPSVQPVGESINGLSLGVQGPLYPLASKARRRRSLRRAAAAPPHSSLTAAGRGGARAGGAKTSLITAPTAGRHMRRYTQ
eukprot:CAMPEP_0196754442 /NCGR_PEP_ID=MMETSP1091-20130531/93915_1 /TAXON_ID=302021 /ORGANISM="Rhodomonas sp., Strain CCMP768" /LENGTH=91 /DNA_ID=CAMNT_0042102703 /DNA_START=151 /DNA_END=423 /DNA_ORIENTATION=+